MFRDLTPDEVLFTVHSYPEDIPVRGNLVDTGDQAEDRAIEDDVIARLYDGDTWAWCCVTVRAADPETGLGGTDHLGGCSYEDEADFRRGGYFEDMCAQALAELNTERRRMYNALQGVA